MALGRFLDPKNDLAFKRIFGTEKNQDILIHFLNDIFALHKAPIQKVIFLKTVQIPEIAVQRSSLVDVLCEDQRGDRFIIEMQVDGEPGFEKRAQYYAAKAYVEQRKTQTDNSERVDYTGLKQIRFLAITSHILFKNKKTYLSHHRMLDIETQEHDLVEFGFSFLELPKFKKKKGELSSIIEKWAYFLKHAENTDEADLETIIGSDLIIKRAYDEISRFGWTTEELRYYDSLDMKRWSERSVLAGAKEEGIAIGEARGIAKRDME
ncbi:MAG: Rpn family recombination-promoting nuclease/putative transposase, partial [Myxococcaceae bacterium]